MSGLTLGIPDSRYQCVRQETSIDGVNAEVELKLLGPEFCVPKYQTDGAAGMDVVANVPEPIKMFPGDMMLIPLGFALNIKSKNIVAKLYPRSSLGLKGIILANTTGIIDSDYQGEVKAALWHRGNLYNDPLVINPGDRIAQMLFEIVARIENFNLVSEFSEKTARGEGGFGHTGVK